jgi:hypothetical protein
VGGSVAPDESKTILELLLVRREEAVKLIDAVGWRRLWSQMGETGKVPLLRQLGLGYWATRGLAEKKDEVEYLTRGRVDSLSHELIIAILRSSPAREMQAIYDDVLVWNHDVAWSRELAQLQKAG